MHIHVFKPGRSWYNINTHIFPFPSYFCLAETMKTDTLSLEMTTTINSGIHSDIGDI